MQKASDAVTMIVSIYPGIVIDYANIRPYNTTIWHDGTHSDEYTFNNDFNSDPGSPGTWTKATALFFGNVTASMKTNQAFEERIWLLRNTDINARNFPADVKTFVFANYNDPLAANVNWGKNTSTNELLFNFYQRDAVGTVICVSLSGWRIPVTMP